MPSSRILAKSCTPMGNLLNAMVTIYNFFGGHYSPMGVPRLVGIVLYFGDSEVPPEAVIEAPAVIGVWVAVATQNLNNR